MTFANPFESRHNFTGMQRIVDQRDDPATLWTAAMQATHLRMATAGLSYYAKLAPTTDSAPAIVYTQYADCQESLSRFDEALPHRQAAIALDPSADNYQRLGITLGHLKNWADADEAYEKST
jgi:tetratricopeptide (TPR) repeat protein